MGQKPTIYVGTIGQSIWRSADGGESWERATQGLFPESDIRAIAINPQNPAILFAGSGAGIYRSQDGADSWSLIDSPMNDRQIWSLAINPKNPDILYAGTCPSALFRSDDGGDTWKQLNVELAPDCGPGIPVIPRVTTITIDPEDEQIIYAGIEIDGMRISHDGGETWTEGSEGLSSLDIHGLAVIPGAPKTLVAATNNDVCITTDMKNWTPLSVKDHYPWPYCRNLLYLSDNGSSRLYVGAGNGPPGDEGGLFYTTDLGDTPGSSWSRVDLGGNANSTIWALAHNPATPEWIFAYSVHGQLYRSTDSGHSWTKLAREFGEVRAMIL
ncbi:MAG: hypothetical protein AAF702_22865 [Chloroflexota bacterium]